MVSITYTKKKILLSEAKFAQGGREVGKIPPGRGGREEGKIRSKTNFTPFIIESCQIWDHFFPLLFPQSLEMLDIWLQEVGAEKRLNGTSKVNRRTDTQRDISTCRNNRPRGLFLWKIWGNMRIALDPNWNLEFGCKQSVLIFKEIIASQPALSPHKKRCPKQGWRGGGGNCKKYDIKTHEPKNHPI